jgi:hypothetical protein
MANVIQLSRYRVVTQRDLQLDIPMGDSDLRPVAVLLWVASIIRVSLALMHHQSFDVEATLALVCALILPLFILRARHAHLRARHAHDTARQ